MTPYTPCEYQESQSQFIKLIISRYIFTWCCQMWRPGLDHLCRLTTTEHSRFSCVDKDHRKGRRTVCGKKQLIAAVENGPAGVFTDIQGATICANIHPKKRKRDHRKNCESCPTQVTWKVNVCPVCLEIWNFAPASKYLPKCLKGGWLFVPRLLQKQE